MRGFAGLVSPQGSFSLTCRWPSSVSVPPGLPSVLSCVLPSSSKDTRPIGFGPTPMNSLNLRYFLKDQKSNYRHVLDL